LNDQNARGHKDTDIYHGPYTVTDVAYDGLSATVLIDGISRTFPVEELKLSRQARPSRHQNVIATPTLDAQNADTGIVGVSAPDHTSDSQADAEEAIAPPAAPTPPKKRRNEFRYDRVIGSRGTPGTDRFYRVQWDTETFPQSYDSWEPESQFPEAQRAELAQSWPLTAWRATFNVTITDILHDSVRYPQQTRRRKQTQQDVVLLQFVNDGNTDRPTEVPFEHLPPNIFKRRNLWLTDRDLAAAKAAHDIWRVTVDQDE
jgi:hypothetical protein